MSSIDQKKVRAFKCSGAFKCNGPFMTKVRLSEPKQYTLPEGRRTLAQSNESCAEGSRSELDTSSSIRTEESSTRIEASTKQIQPAQLGPAKQSQGDTFNQVDNNERKSKNDSNGGVPCCNQDVADSNNCAQENPQPEQACSGDADEIQAAANQAWMRLELATKLDAGCTDNAEDAWIKANLTGSTPFLIHRLDRYKRFVSECGTENQQAQSTAACSNNASRNDNIERTERESTGLRSAMTSPSRSAFADLVSSSAGQRNFVDSTTPAKQWTSADELKPFPDPLLVPPWLGPILSFFFLVLALLLCQDQFMSTHMPGHPTQKHPALSVAESSILSKYQLVFLQDHSESMDNTFDCPLGADFASILTSRTDWARRQLDRFSKQAFNSLPDGFSVVSVERMMWPFDTDHRDQPFCKVNASAITRLEFALQKAIDERSGSKPLALVVLTDANSGEVSEKNLESLQFLKNRIKDAKSRAGNLRVVFLSTGNNLQGWDKLKELSINNIVSTVPFSKSSKSDIAGVLANELK